ncbi:MAG: carboxylesterase/lipase family protein [Bdellovibrionota bacterium]
MINLAALSLLTSLSTAHAGDPSLVNTKYGAVQGFNLDSTVSFRGIPYAAAPVGALRWAPSTPPAAHAETLVADHFGPACPQMQFFALGSRETIGDEDCLSLNIWRPQAGANLPVMVFIHGGGNSVGSSHDLNGTSLYDGDSLANRGPAVVVTINYRLGVLGFLAHPGLSAQSPEGVSGNYALLDQIQALRWVRENIAGFGGNPANVTVFGESAGAIDILALLASPRAEGLFQRAIIESGFLTEQPLAVAEAEGLKFAKAIGCEDVACLRAKSAGDLVKAADLGEGKLRAYAAAVDGKILPTGVLDAFRAGRALRVPLIIGTNANEMSTLLPFVSDVRDTLTESGYAEQLNKDLGTTLGPKALALYPSAQYGSPYQAYLNVANDSFAHCPTRRIARAFGSPVWRYVFTHTSDNPFFAPYGAGHGLELPFVFRASENLSMQELRLADTFQGYWTSFARTGNPNGEGLPEWKSFRGSEYQQLDTETKAMSGFRGELCDFWDAAEI